MIYGVGIVSALVAAEHILRSNVRRRGNELPPLALGWKLIPAVIMTQSLSMHYLVQTLFLRRIDWRGVSYRIGWPDRIRLSAYRPFRPSARPESSHSVL